MKVIEFSEVNTQYGQHQPQYFVLPALKVEASPEGKMVCCWKLSLRERISVLFTGKIWHQILTFDQPLQPQLLSVIKPNLKP